MKEDHFSRLAKKIRNKLIYYTYIELKKKPIDNNSLLINSMTPNEINGKYQKCSDYCVEKTETYTSSQNNNDMDSNNYFHVSVTYCSFNNNYHMLVDNKNVDQYIGKNNIIGKYYKGNNLQIGTTTDTIKYDIYLNENKLEKKIIGENKFKKKHRSIVSSLDINKKLCFIANENINVNEINDLKSINNEENIKKIINEKINNEKIQTNCGNKIRKTNTHRIFYRHMIKLKSYCANLINIEKHPIVKQNKHNYNNYNNINFSPINEKKKKNKNDKNHVRSGKEKPKYTFHRPMIHESEIMTSNILNSSNPKSKENQDMKNGPLHPKLKSQTKIHQNLFKLGKRSFHIKNNKSVDKFEESPKKKTPKKVSSSRKINNINTIPGMTISKFYNAYQKDINNKKDKEKEKTNNTFNVKKMLSDKNNKDYIINNKRKVNNFNNNNNHVSSKVYNIEKTNSNLFRMNGKNITKKLEFKKSLTIKNIYKFRAADILEKKISTINKMKNNK